MNQSEVHDRLRSLSGWQLQGDTLIKEFTFKDFTAAFAFMTAAAKEAEAANHHPDWSNSYNKVRVTLSTHSEGGVTDKDVRLAEVMNRLADE